MTAPDRAMIGTAKALPSIAKAIGDALASAAGEPVCFALMVFKVGDPAVHGQRAQYVSNVDREMMTKALEETLERFKAGHIRPPAGSGLPESN